MPTLIAPVLLFAIAAPAPDRNVQKLRALRGVWIVTAIESHGKNIAIGEGKEKVPPQTLVLCGERYAFSEHGGTIKLDVFNQAVDLVAAQGRFKNYTFLGIYEHTGETLKIALPNPLLVTARPREFKTQPSTTHSTYTFRRDNVMSKDEVERLLEARMRTLAGR